MALQAGTRLGVYEVTAQIGEGGMGQVYRARDTKLDRDVAIKILQELFAVDADPSTSSGSSRARSRDERIARFQREARTLASLNHPHIAQIYGLGEAASPEPSALCPEKVQFLVMELVEGEDLS